MFDEEVFKRIGGWFTVTEAKYLYEKAIEHEGLIVELGSWTGKSTYALACAVRDSGKPPMIAVDRFTGSSEHTSGERVVWTFPDYYNNLKGVGVIPNHVITIIGDTVQTARIFADESIGLLLHDASHELEFLREDLRAWLPKVRKDGLISVHDQSPSTVLGANEQVGVKLVYKDSIRFCPICGPASLTSYTRVL